MRKALSIMLAVSMLAASVPAVYAADGNTAVVDSQKEVQDKFTWDLGKDGTLTISGTGEVSPKIIDGKLQNYDWNDKKAEIKKVVVEEGITGLNSAWNNGYPNLTEVVLPEGLEYLGGIFYGSPNLEKINLPKSLKTMMFDALNGTKVFKEEAETVDGGIYFRNVLVGLETRKETVGEGEYQEEIDVATADALFKVKEGTTVIAYNAFPRGNSIQGLVIPEGVKVLEDLGYLRSVVAISLPTSLEKIDLLDGFSYFERLSKIYYAGTEDDWKKVEGSNEFSDEHLKKFFKDSEKPKVTLGYYDEDNQPEEKIEKTFRDKDFDVEPAIDNRNALLLLGGLKYTSSNEDVIVLGEDEYETTIAYIKGAGEAQITVTANDDTFYTVKPATIKVVVYPAMVTIAKDSDENYILDLNNRTATLTGLPEGAPFELDFDKIRMEIIKDEEAPTNPGTETEAPTTPETNTETETAALADEEAKDNTTNNPTENDKTATTPSDKTEDKTEDKSETPTVPAVTDVKVKESGFVLTEKKTAAAAEEEAAVNYGKPSDYVISPESIETTVKSDKIAEIKAEATTGGKAEGSCVVLKGAEVTVTAKADSGYGFVGWFKDDTAVSTDKEYTFAAKENAELTARFTKSSSGGSGAPVITGSGRQPSSGSSGSSETKPEDDKKNDTDAKTEIVLTISSTDVVIDGKTVKNDVAPMIVNDRTMLPIRVIAEKLGAKVEWNGETKLVKVSMEGIEIELIIGDSFATVNGERVTLDAPSFIANDRTYLPIRFVSEKLGADVKWNDEAKTVTITK